MFRRSKKRSSGVPHRDFRGKRSILRGAQSESGQSLIEFALSIVLVFGLLFFFIQLALILSWGNFVQYATFMSARAYLSAGPTRADQEDRAKLVLTRMVKRGTASNDDRFPMIAVGQGGEDDTVKGASIGGGPGFDPGNYDLSWMQGVRYTFRSRLFVLPIGRPGSAPTAAKGQAILTSESWLGRDPSYQECLSTMGQMKGQIDNGC
ncbi:MAG: pilus assembly protein [Cryobacterium sp.]|nr:pilus assembly protein [Oligoflexia bacterium]